MTVDLMKLYVSDLTPVWEHIDNPLPILCLDNDSSHAAFEEDLRSMKTAELIVPTADALATVFPERF